MPHQNDEYAQVARLYDPLTGPFLRGVRQAVVALARARNAHTAVDICCGTGAQLIALDRAGCTCTGVDLSLPMLAVARRKSPPSITYVNADGTQIPLANESFDITILAFALHEKPAPVRKSLLAEAMRLLKPGGTLAVTDYLAPRGLLGLLGHLGVGLFERAAGAEHHAQYREYLAQGGTLGLLELRGLHPEQVSPSHLGAVGLVTLRKP
ncbi:MAG: class I SAM-dependent methyltransferase [Proteobacteria bacterium]|nr:class I SAM-dependent methyltransferase [Pseudomonadota bacterium]